MDRTVSGFLRTAAAIGALVVLGMAVMGNPYQLSQWALWSLGVFAFCAVLLTVLVDYMPLFGASMERRILFGFWNVEKQARDYHATWKFDKDGTATVQTREYLDHGRWRFKRSCVRLVWDSFIPGTKQHCYETFRRPLKTRGVHGRSWQDDLDDVPQDQGCVRAKKLRDLE